MSHYERLGAAAVAWRDATRALAVARNAYHAAKHADEPTAALEAATVAAAAHCGRALDALLAAALGLP